MSSTPPHTESNALSQPLLNVFLMLVESFFALVLRFDSRLRRAVYPLVKSGAVVRVRTYLPHTQIYVSFDYKGILLDDRLPSHKKEATVAVNAYAHELLAVAISGNPSKIDALQMLGDPADVALLRDVLGKLGLFSLLSSLIAKARPSSPTPEQKAQKQRAQSEKIADLEEKLLAQTQEAERLTSENRKLRTQVGELQGKQKSFTLALGVASGVALVAILFHFV